MIQFKVYWCYLSAHTWDLSFSKYIQKVKSKNSGVAPIFISLPFLKHIPEIRNLRTANLNFPKKVFPFYRLYLLYMWILTNHSKMFWSQDSIKSNRFHGFVFYTLTRPWVTGCHNKLLWDIFVECSHSSKGTDNVRFYSVRGACQGHNMVI